MVTLSRTMLSGNDAFTDLLFPSNCSLNFIHILHHHYYKVLVPVRLLKLNSEDQFLFTRYDFWIQTPPFWILWIIGDLGFNSEFRFLNRVFHGWSSDFSTLVSKKLTIDNPRFFFLFHWIALHDLRMDTRCIFHSRDMKEYSYFPIKDGKSADFLQGSPTKVSKNRFSAHEMKGGSCWFDGYKVLGRGYILRHSEYFFVGQHLRDTHEAVVVGELLVTC
ncbi:hypothetical protein SSX86_023013 [Deinandra increscens subsp. villosa]|uniref:Uncharacterized protein n=1 Tax=Deinandra increscens subsp. villosa TaxID=3103831 RepID=A0AAP0CB65_9ASTR